MFFCVFTFIVYFEYKNGNYPTSGLEQAEYSWLLLPREVLTIAVETFIVLP